MDWDGRAQTCVVEFRSFKVDNLDTQWSLVGCKKRLQSLSDELWWNVKEVPDEGRLPKLSLQKAHRKHQERR